MELKVKARENAESMFPSSPAAVPVSDPVRTSFSVIPDSNNVHRATTSGPKKAVYSRLPAWAEGVLHRCRPQEVRLLQAHHSACENSFLTGYHLAVVLEAYLKDHVLLNDFTALICPYMTLNPLFLLIPEENGIWLGPRTSAGRTWGLSEDTH